MEDRKKLSIMQPYLFPYIGYFQLIEASDKIVFLDDVTYINKGWINRNKVLSNSGEYLFTLPLIKSSQNKLIKGIYPLNDSNFKNKFTAHLVNTYKKAPYFKEVFDLVQKVLSKIETLNLADIAVYSIESVCNYLDKDLNFSKSSICCPESKGQEKAERLINITHKLEYGHYINLSGGIELYNKTHFLENNVELHFIKSDEVIYKQFNSDFIPSLSIIDVLMFNSKKDVSDFMKMYSYL